jgi:hypothetical protein
MPRRITLYVQRVSGLKIIETWLVGDGMIDRNQSYYVKCNKNGEINWSKTLVYQAHELVGRDLVKVLNK